MSQQPHTLYLNYVQPKWIDTQWLRLPLVTGGLLAYRPSTVIIPQSTNDALSWLESRA